MAHSFDSKTNTRPLVVILSSREAETIAWWAAYCTSRDGDKCKTSNSDIVRDALSHYVNNPPPPRKGRLGEGPQDNLVHRTYWVNADLLTAWQENADAIGAKRVHMVRGAIVAWINHLRATIEAHEAYTKAKAEEKYQAALANGRDEHTKALAERGISGKGSDRAVFNIGRWVVKTHDGTFVKRFSRQKPAIKFAAKYDYHIEDTMLPPLPPMPQAEYMASLESAQAATEAERDIWTLPTYMRDK